MPDSDSLYHRLFVHPLMIEGLVREFVPEVLAAGVDFTRMERVPAKFHSRTGQRRDGDMIWRLPTGSGTDIYLYLLLEFQSQIDWWMAVRIQVYAGLLWQHLIDEHKLKSGDRLPPILPIVLYNSSPRWKAPTDTAGLIALPEDSSLWPWQPRVRYHLLDEGAFPGDDLARRDHVVALLFRLENCRRPDALIGLIDEVIGWFRCHPDYETVKRLFVEVIRQAADKTKARDVTIPEDLQEVRIMLAQHAQDWKEEWIAEGIAKGLAKGKAEGKAEGVAVGVAVGKAEMLLRQLGRRFGPLPPDLGDRVRAAGNDQLDEWSDRILEAGTLTDVFPDDRPH